MEGIAAKLLKQRMPMESEAQAAKRERREGKRRPMTLNERNNEGGVPGGTGSPSYPGKETIA